jgi:catechol 2,3-dioxygenase-like lactoylglutathione lyase family enzyme
MTVEVIGVDHIFVSVGNLGRSEEFYDRVMTILGFRKGEGTISGDPQPFYYNRQFAYSLRPAREGAPGTPLAPSTKAPPNSPDPRGSKPSTSVQNPTASSRSLTVIPV